MRAMIHRRRFFVAAALAVALATPLSGRQDAAALQSADPPANGIWLDSLDLSNAPIRRGRGQRGQTPPPLVFRLGGAIYAHALPLQSDGDLAIDLGGAATKFVAIIGVDDGAPPAAPSLDGRGEQGRGTQAGAPP